MINLRGKTSSYLSFAFQGIEDIPTSSVRKHADTTTCIDLSCNNFKELHSLEKFRNLHTAILDSNAIASNTVFPRLPNLKLISLNDNKIDNLTLFISRLCEDVPGLRFLSMMKNDAAPSYFNGGTKQENQDYRYFVISHFPLLESLDGQQVTEGEKFEAYTVYGQRWKLKDRKMSKFFLPTVPQGSELDE